MEPAKKVEVIIDSLDVPEVLDGLGRIGIHRYTAINGVLGHGEGSDSVAAPFLSAFENTYVMIVCSDAQAQQILDVVQPFLKRRGGVCLLSDVQRLT